MKTIQTLVPDIYEFIQNPPERIDDRLVQEFAGKLAKIISSRLSSAGREPPRLRVSNLGEKCDRRLWYSVNHPELAEPLPASARLKFLFGDILEALLLLLAKCSGHLVENEQKEIEINGVKGHIDGTIDNELVDCKSASTAGFDKFSSHSLESDDPFGYLVQLGSYGSRVGSGLNHFLAIDKQHGHIVLDSYPKAGLDFTDVVRRKRAVLTGPLPERGYEDEAHQKSGNRKLGVACSYCAFKFSCWPNLRVAYYSGRPVFLTKVIREPKVRTSRENQIRSL